MMTTLLQAKTIIKEILMKIAVFLSTLTIGITKIKKSKLKRKRNAELYYMKTRSGIVTAKDSTKR